MKHIRFGMIGCGSVTEVKSGPAFNKIPGASLDMVMCRNLERLKDYARRHGVPRYSTDYLDVMRDSDIDAIYIATPPDSHAFYTLEAARHGKAVYVEKPMALSVAECVTMRDACRAAGVPLYVAYYRRGQPRFLKARELIVAGKLGQIRSFQYTHACPQPKLDPARAWLLNPAQAGGGLLYDIGSHMINAICFLLGQPLEVVSRSAKDHTGDTHSAIMRFENGAQGSLQLSFNAAEQVDELWISGSKGSIQMPLMFSDALTWREGDTLHDLVFDPIPHVQQPYIQQVVRSLQGQGGLEATGAEGLLTQELLEAIDQGKDWRRKA